MGFRTYRGRRTLSVKMYVPGRCPEFPARFTGRNRADSATFPVRYTIVVENTLTTRDGRVENNVRSRTRKYSRVGFNVFVVPCPACATPYVEKPNALETCVQ